MHEKARTDEIEASIISWLKHSSEKHQSELAKRYEDRQYQHDDDVSDGNIEDRQYQYADDVSDGNIED